MKLLNINKNRNSNIELLRIICMLCIVAHHCALHGGLFFGVENSPNRYIAGLFIPIGKIVFDCFLAISAWFMTDSKFKAERFFRAWFTVLFYNVVFTFAARLISGDTSAIGIRQIVGSFMPMMGNSHTFASSYLLFLLIVPFLQLITNKLNFQSGLVLLIITFCIEILSQTVGLFIMYKQPISSEIALFILVYFAAWFLKTWIMPNVNPKKCLIVCILLFLGLYFVSYEIRIRSVMHPSDTINTLVTLMGTEASILNIVAGFSLFCCFLIIKIKHSAIINAIASATFGVLLFHDHTFFRPVLWSLIEPKKWYSSSPKMFLLKFVAGVFGVFIAGVLIDALRRLLLEKPLLKSKPVALLCEKLNGILSFR